MKKQKILLLAFVGSLLAFVEVVVASEDTVTPASASTMMTNASPKITLFQKVNGLVMLDYEVIPVPGKQAIDLHGIHYLQQVQDWLYLGIGLYAPLVSGNYGGFMAFDTTVHTQQKVFGDYFLDAGAAVGGGGGGSSIEKSKDLSGTGGFAKVYFGLGYDFHSFSAGVNYAHFGFKESQINHSQFNFFIQEPVSYFVGSYESEGKILEAPYALPDTGESILGMELNNLFQIKPTGGVKETINTLSLQFSHFSSENWYSFFALEVGYKGLPLYNQAFSGFGYRTKLSPRINLHAQVGIGSGGYAPSKVDTGAGLLVYPKASLEYLFGNHLGISLSGGILIAPTGTSKNTTLGLAVNYHRSMKEKFSLGVDGREFTGFRFNLFQQTEFGVKIGGDSHHDIQMLTSQFDYIVNDYWYLPIQGNIAYNDFLGYPGYGEILFGLGLQSRILAGDGQLFFQALIGANVHGMLLKPSVGFNYNLNASLSAHVQLGESLSLDKYNLYPDAKRLRASFVGVGLTYRFSLLQ